MFVEAWPGGLWVLGAALTPVSLGGAELETGAWRLAGPTGFGFSGALPGPDTVWIEVRGWGPGKNRGGQAAAQGRFRRNPGRAPTGLWEKGKSKRPPSFGTGGFYQFRGTAGDVGIWALEKQATSKGFFAGC